MNRMFHNVLMCVVMMVAITVGSYVIAQENEQNNNYYINIDTLNYGDTDDYED